jgi:hypothetical protein
VHPWRFVTGLVLGFCFAAPAFAGTAYCLLEVRGKRYIDGQCEFTVTTLPNEPARSFQILKGNYFAQVNVETPGKANGYWNEDPRATHAHSNLGVLTQRGACWTNDAAKVCAWKSGDRRQ